MDDDGSDGGNGHKGYRESDDGQGDKGELEVANSDGNGENDSDEARVGLRK